MRWDDPPGSEVKIEPEFRKLHIYDGGAYDNLGSESLFDPGRGVPKYEKLSILVSDAGSPLEQGFGKGPFNPFRLKRILDISMEQARALHVRSLMTYFSENPRQGAYLMIGQHPSEILEDEMNDLRLWQSEEAVESAADYGTSLSKMCGKDFEKIAQHGYESIKAVEMCVGDL
jgi:NTE family protein